MNTKLDKIVKIIVYIFLSLGMGAIICMIILLILTIIAKLNGCL